MNGQTIANNSNATFAGAAVNDIRSISLDLTNGFIYYTANPNGYDVAPYHAANAVYKVAINGTGAASVPVQLTSSTQFPAGTNGGVGGGNATQTDPNGLIGQVVVDVAHNLVYFTTSEFTSPVSGGTNTTQDAIWYVTTNGGANQTAQKVTGIPLTFASGSAQLAFDANTRQLYISDQAQGAGGVPSRIIIAQLDSTGHNATSTSTFAVAPLVGETSAADPDELVNGLFFIPTASGPTLGTIPNASFTEGSAVTLAPAVTVTASGNVTGATVTISSGALTGDVLAATNAGSVTASYNSGTHVLTLSGTDTAAHYQQVLDLGELQQYRRCAHQRHRHRLAHPDLEPDRRQQRQFLYHRECRQ